MTHMANPDGSQKPVSRRSFFKGAGASAAAIGTANWTPGGQGQAPKAQPAYVPERDPLVLKKLDQWQDWKFGFLMHWGPYSQLGVVESWSICSEDRPFCKRPSGISYVDYVKKYEQLPTTFNPVRFGPDRWASAAQAAGMKYVVFTTKHHDGFSMFDTKLSDYRITGPDVPFHTNPRANVAKEVFGAFRKKNFGIGAYFSKPDWHSPDYWAPEWATPTRNVNYDTRKHPERWKAFVEFTHKQIDELTSQYGPIDVLWLDGGWVDSKTDPNALAGSGKVPWPQDIDMAGITALARRNQPGLIMVNRAEGGPYENYRTPEKEIPDKELPYPWETCMPMGDSWSYAPNDNYKPARELVHKLIDINAKGGNFLLNAGPDPNGELPEVALQRMAEIGAWMKINGDAVYGSRPIAPYVEEKLRFTRLKDESVNVIYLLDENEAVPGRFELHGLSPVPGARMRILGNGGTVTWKRDGEHSVIEIPEAARGSLTGSYAFTIQISAVQKKNV
jgi:alpha-L-fucosidase